jgi:hypothetical protein
MDPLVVITSLMWSNRRATLCSADRVCLVATILTVVRVFLSYIAGHGDLRRIVW